MAARRKASGRKAARKKGARRARSRARKRATKKAPRKGASGRRASALSIDSAFNALLRRGDKYKLLCVGAPEMRTTCCDNWNTLEPPELGKKMVALMEAMGYGDKLDEDEKNLIRAWPEHQLLAITRAIQSVCRVHGFVHPSLSKEKRKGPHGVAISITEPDSTLPPNKKKAPVKAVFQHPDFKK
jgi:hypothetical protein